MSSRRRAEQLPPSLRDSDPRHLERAAAGDHALRLRCREPGADQFDHLLDRETMRQHNRLGAAIAAGGEQFERAAASGLGNVLAARHRSKVYPAKHPHRKARGGRWCVISGRGYRFTSGQSHSNLAVYVLDAEMTVRMLAFESLLPPSRFSARRVCAF
jgi:hypothetical protein